MDEFKAYSIIPARRGESCPSDDSIHSRTICSSCLRRTYMYVPICSELSFTIGIQLIQLYTCNIDCLEVATASTPKISNGFKKKEVLLRITLVSISTFTICHTRSHFFVILFNTFPSAYVSILCCCHSINDLWEPGL